MTDKEIQASDEEMEQFNILQNEKCVSVKTEKLNDLKNRISFALKGATLQQGFEIICKRIAELEKENEDLKKQIDCYKAFESHYEEIEEDAKAIAKENAELKAQNKDLCESLDIMNNRESELLDQIEKMKKDFSNALDCAYSNQALYELWKRWEYK